MRIKPYGIVLVTLLACSTAQTIAGDGGGDGRGDTDAGVPPACNFDVPCVEGAQCVQDPFCYRCATCSGHATYDKGALGTTGPAILVCAGGNWSLAQANVIVDCWGVGRFSERTCSKLNAFSCVDASVITDASDADAATSDAAPDG